MQYLGGKFRLAKKIKAEILPRSKGRDTYWEPFVGGGHTFAALAPEFRRSIASDVHPDLILMWQSVAKGWNPPDSLSESEYASLRQESPSALRAFAGFGCSFGGKWFGGYARNNRGYDYCRGSKRSVARKAPVFATANISHMSYDQMTPGDQFTVYCDPPYVGTTSYKGAPEFDHDAFWSTARNWIKAGAQVFVSEYSAPVDFIQVAEFPHEMNVSSPANRRPTVERLFVHESQERSQ